MTGPQGMGPIMPMQKFPYDGYLTDAIWFSKLLPNSSVDWPTIFEAILYDIANETSTMPGWAGGLWSFNAWWDESGEAPTSYDSFLTTTANAIWYLKPRNSSSTYTAWPNFATAVSNNIWLDSGTTPYSGPTYFNHWMDESGYGPTTYDSAVSTIGRIWDSDLDTLT